MFHYIKKIKAAKNIFVLPEINLGGGGTKTILSYIQEKRFQGEEVVYIILNQKLSYLKLLIASIWGRRLIFNGLYSCSGLLPKLVVYFRKNTKIYTHESSFYFEHFMSGGSLNQFFLKKVMSGRHILYCSEWQYQNISSYLTPSKKTILYECLSVNSESINFLLSKSRSLTIGMAGYLQERKGTSKFEAVASRAKDLSKDWTFVWIGGKASNKQIPRGTNVHYLGNVDGTLHFLSKIDLLLFTSLEDPLPIVILETILLRKRMLLSKENGFYELLQGIDGIDFFDRNDSTDVLIQKTQRLLTIDIDESAYEKLINKLCNVTSFIERIEQLND